MTGKTGTLVAVLAGAAIGAGLGILFAPDQGANTRRKIREGYGTKKGELKDKLNELTEQLKNRLGTSKADLESGFDRLVASVEDKKDDIIDTLERKLEELKSNRYKAGETQGTAGSQGSTGSESTGATSGI
jgi:gas vesicle protein